MEHTDDVTCLDANESIVVTGQLGANPLICVWDAATGQSKMVLTGTLKKGIGNVCISQDGK